MKVKARITFEVEYGLSLEFHETDDKYKVLEMERTYIADDPLSKIRTFGTRGKFETSVEVMDPDPEPKKPGNVNKTWIDGTYTIKSKGTTDETFTKRL